MKRVTRLTSHGVLTFVVALAAATIQLQKPAAVQAAGTAPVTVMNTPLPVSLSGTGTITGHVNAAQSGAWNVGVTNLPAVQLAPGTTVGITGGFSNTANPIFARDVDEPARNAYVLGLCATSKFQTCDGVTVPAGTRYVIEQVSGECNVGSESSIGGFKLTAHLNGADNVYYFHDKISAGGGGATTVGPFFQESRIYTDGGVQNGISARVFDAGGSGPGAACSITLSGYLVSMTQ